MENVEGLLSAGTVEVLSEAIDTVASQYTVLPPLMVSAARFGAATSRKRVIVVGYDPSEVDPIASDDLQGGNAAFHATVRDAIADVPGPIAVERNDDWGWAKYAAKNPRSLSGYARALRQSPPAGLGNREAVERLAAGYVSGLAATRHSPEIARRYATTPGGKCDPITKSLKLEWNGLCNTLRAGTGSEKGAFQAVRPLHPGKGRVITVREAARMQGFPDWFAFHPTKWHSFRMLGNSVSPMVSCGLLSALTRKILLPLAA